MKLVLSTCAPADAERLAGVLVEAGLAACCNQLPGVLSTYRWQGAVVTEPETLLLFKTRDDAVEALKGRLAELHPYEVPEIVVLEAADVAAAYLAWVSASSGPGGGGSR